MSPLFISKDTTKLGLMHAPGYEFYECDRTTCFDQHNYDIHVLPAGLLISTCICMYMYMYIHLHVCKLTGAIFLHG